MFTSSANVFATGGSLCFIWFNQSKLSRSRSTQPLTRRQRCTGEQHNSVHPRSEDERECRARQTTLEKHHTQPVRLSVVGTLHTLLLVTPLCQRGARRTSLLMPLNCILYARDHIMFVSDKMSFCVQWLERDGAARTCIVGCTAMFRLGWHSAPSLARCAFLFLFFQFVGPNMRTQSVSDMRAYARAQFVLHTIEPPPSEGRRTHAHDTRQQTTTARMQDLRFGARAYCALSCMRAV